MTTTRTTDQQCTWPSGIHAMRDGVCTRCGATPAPVLSIGDTVTLAGATVPGIITRVQVEGDPAWNMTDIPFPHYWVRWEGSADALPYPAESLTPAAHIPAPWQSVTHSTHSTGARDSHGVTYGANIVTDASGVAHDIEEVTPNHWRCKTHDTPC